MTREFHERAMGLIAAARVEGISSNDREWLDGHLQVCQECSEFAGATERTIRALQFVTVQVNPALLARTKRAVHQRAREMQSRRSQLWPLWMSCALSWILGGITLPWVWSGIQWAGQYLNLPSAFEVFLIVLWWALPTLCVAVFASARGVSAVDE